MLHVRTAAQRVLRQLVLQLQADALRRLFADARRTDQEDGALALGDIGKFFPDTDAAYKGIDSKILLKEVMRLVEERGWQVVNADLTIALQAPKLRPHIDAMRESLAAILKVDVSRVSVKATTTERLGFVGRQEGCEVWASVLLGC
ncbi:MAG: 2-C-methyl-D-erythritol 2,4-cyclodiphosphate synthase [Bacteroidales bacterium]|nr:2-C-methyl-D-erythritol 2,4-cyclodiphosphate synthase [Bacteroidales bacterium]